MSIHDVEALVAAVSPFFVGKPAEVQGAALADLCGRPYRGPAVYCTFECATADA
jgi:hypothetical protein